MTRSNMVLALIIVVLAVMVFMTNKRLHESPAQDVAAINTLYDDWLRAVEEGDAALYVSVLDPDIELIPTDAKPLHQTADYANFLVGVFANDSFKIERQGDKEIVVRGDYAFARYDYRIIRTNTTTGAVFPSDRNFVDILRKDKNGQWHVLKHIWNYTTPDVTP